MTIIQTIHFWGTPIDGNPHFWHLHHWIVILAPTGGLQGEEPGHSTIAFQLAPDGDAAIYKPWQICG